MSSFLQQIKGFTPVIDVVVQDVGLVTANVYGVVWRYCQMRDGVCRASHETLAQRLGLNRVTVVRHLKKLCNAGYLEDLTPELHNRPHTYRDTGKVIIEGLIEAKSTVTESNSTVTLSDTHCNLKLHEDTIRYNKDTHPPAQNSKSAGSTPAPEEHAVVSSSKHHETSLAEEDSDGAWVFARMGLNSAFTGDDLLTWRGAAARLSGSELQDVATYVCEEKGVTGIAGVRYFLNTVKKKCTDREPLPQRARAVGIPMVPCMP